jgi:hypothetical protein
MSEVRTGPVAVIVSAFGRSLWLAQELIQKGFIVKVLDVTDMLGRFAKEDAEGPFGVFQTERFTRTQTQRLTEEGNLLGSPQGFTVWLNSGPLELKGILTQYQLTARQLIHGLQDILHPARKQLSKEARKNLSDKDIHQIWIALLAHYFAANQSVPVMRALELGSYLPLFGDFGIRTVNRTGSEKVLDWLTRAGVEVFRSTRLVDAVMAPGSQLEKLEIKQGKVETSQLVTGDYFVLTLSSEELHFVNSRLGSLLYPLGPIRPLWVWTRTRVKPERTSVQDQLPVHSLWIDQIEAPWTHENFMVVIRTGTPEQFDVWFKIPNEQRFNKAYLEHKLLRVETFLKKRLLANEMSWIELPEGLDKTYLQVGPSQNPIFQPEHLFSRRSELKNTLFASPEDWGNLNWDGRLQKEAQDLRTLELWKAKWEAKNRKQLREGELR